MGERLRGAGMRYVFGHPGGEVVDLIEGFRQAGLEFVLTRHETAAAFMAEATASSSGAPGACLATLGPGATNLITGVAHAYLDRAAVVVFTGQLPADRYGIATHQRLDLGALFAPVTKWQARVTAINAVAVTERGLRVAMRPRRGPVYLEVPSDVPRQEEPGGLPPPAPAATPLDGAIDPGSVQDAARLIAESRRPVILAGIDALDDRVVMPLRRLAEGWSCPVMVGPKAKGILREDHPLFLGTIEGLGTAKLFEWIEASDLVLMIGFDPVEFDRDWTARAPVVHVGPLPNDDHYYASAVEVIGPVHQALEALAAAGSPEGKLDAAEIRAFRQSFQAYVRPVRDGLTAQQVLAELRAALPEDAFLTCDVGYNKSVTTQCWPAFAPRTFFVSNGLSSMGYGLPAAVALKLLHPDRPVACVLGDGGFAMSMAELETAARLGLGVIVVVLVDDALSQIKAAQERKGYAVTGTTFGGLDYGALATGFGLRGVTVSDVAGCREAFRSARGADRPVLIAARIDASGYRLG